MVIFTSYVSLPEGNYWDDSRLRENRLRDRISAGRTSKLRLPNEAEAESDQEDHKRTEDTGWRGI